MKNVTLTVGIVIVLVFAGITVFQANTDSSEVLKVGYIGPLSGPSAVLGMDVVPALEMAIQDATGGDGSVEFFVEDDQYLTRKTVDAYSKLVDVHDVDVVLVANYGGVFALMDRAKQDGVTIIDPLDCNDDIAQAAKNVFCISTETESIGASLAEYINENALEKTGVLYSTKDPFMSLVNEAFAESYNGSALTDTFNYEDTDFRTQLTKMKDAGVDSLVLLGHDETGIIMKQARELGMDAPFFTTGTITSPAAQEASGGHAEGTVFAYWESERGNALASEFENRFAEQVGRPPILPLTTHPAYDTMMILLDEVVPSIGGQITGEKISTELLAIEGFEGVTGSITMEADGGARIQESVFRLVDGLPERIE